MVVRARSLLALVSGVAAFPLAAHAGTAIQTPNISCTSTDGGTVSSINWGDFGSFSGAPSFIVDGELVPAVKLGCSGNQWSTGVQGSEFSINWGDFIPPNPIDKWDVGLSTDYKEYKVQLPDGGFQDKWDTFFNLFVNVYKENADGFPVLEFKDFVGVKVDSAFGFATGGDYKIMGDGSVMLDPTIPGGSAEVSLYDTQVPEPATLLLVGGGIAGGILRRKRRTKT